MLFLFFFLFCTDRVPENSGTGNSTAISETRNHKNIGQGSTLCIGGDISYEKQLKKGV